MEQAQEAVKFLSIIKRVDMFPETRCCVMECQKGKLVLSSSSVECQVVGSVKFEGEPMERHVVDRDLLSKFVASLPRESGKKIRFKTQETQLVVSHSLSRMRLPVLQSSVDRLVPKGSWSRVDLVSRDQLRLMCNYGSTSDQPTQDWLKYLYFTKSGSLATDGVAAVQFSEKKKSQFVLKIECAQVLSRYGVEHCQVQANGSIKAGLGESTTLYWSGTTLKDPFEQVAVAEKAIFKTSDVADVVIPVPALFSVLDRFSKLGFGESPVHVKYETGKKNLFFDATDQEESNILEQIRLAKPGTVKAFDIGFRLHQVLPFIKYLLDAGEETVRLCIGGKSSPHLFIGVASRVAVMGFGQV